MFVSEPILTDEGFLLYAAKNYSNPCCSGTDEFLEDIRRIKYIKKLITRFENTNDLKERLILNHVIILGNVFDAITLNRILYLKMEPQFGCVKPFLLGLGLLVKEIINVKEERVVDTDFIVMNWNIVQALRKVFPNPVQVHVK